MTLRDWLLAGTHTAQQARRTRGYVAEARSENPAALHMRAGIMETCSVVREPRPTTFLHPRRLGELVEAGLTACRWLGVHQQVR